jgi:hypothetical protein
MRRRHAVLADNFIRLYLAALAGGIAKPMVLTEAALLSGYGGNSGCPLRARQTACNSALRIMKRPEILKYMEAKGLMYGWNGWNAAVAQDAGEQG